MAKREGRIDDLFAQLPSVFNARENDNWRVIVESLGQADQDTLDLIESVRKQFFVKTASRPYLDRLGTASLVQRPRFVGMDDPTFRDFIPVMSYQPKQVKLIFDQLLDLFFFKESTTSFIPTLAFEPFNLRDGWELEYEVDSYITERIEFREDEFTDISNATANEVVAAINRQSTNSYAIAFENSITREITIRLFTDTVGAKGSIQVIGGRANMALQFDGYNYDAGNGLLTEWEITKVGETATLRYTGNGGNPNISSLEAGDVVMIQRGNNSGTFEITLVDSTDNFIQYKNLFAVPETFVEQDPDVIKFFKPIKTNVFLKDRRAIVWEVRPGEIVVEIPPSPPVVKRKRSGAAHINGIDSKVLNVDADSGELQLAKPDKFPETGGQFFFIPKGEIKTYYPNEDETGIYNFNTRLSTCIPKYTYTSKIGDKLIGITPELPTISNSQLIDVIEAERDSNNIITVTTSTEHDYKVGEHAIIKDNGVQALTNDYSTQFLTADSSYVDLGTNSAHNITDKLSVSFWVNGTSNGAVQAFYSRWDASTNDRQILIFTENVAPFSKLRVLASNDGIGGGGIRKDYVSSVPVLDNSWHFVTVTFDSGDLKIFIDGVEDTAVNKVNDPVFTNLYPVTNNEGTIGAYITPASNYLGFCNAKIDELAIWDSNVLSASDISDLYDSGGITNLNDYLGSANLVSWYRMGDGDTFPIITDQKGVQSGTMVNMIATNFVTDAPLVGPSVPTSILSTLNGTWKIEEIIDDFTFKVFSFAGSAGADYGLGGTVTVERIGISDSAGRALLTSAQIDERTRGPYIWDEGADFVLSSLTTNLTETVDAGSTQRSIQVDPNEIPSEEGRLIFSFGTEKQEGPVRYFYKPNSTSIALDPSYVFENTHEEGSAVTMIRRRGGIEFSGSGSEYAPYITDPAAAREVLQELMQEVKSVGIFINFLVRFPEQYYATIDVYRSGVDPG
jgi:hypothetical protein